MRKTREVVAYYVSLCRSIKRLSLIDMITRKVQINKCESVKLNHASGVDVTLTDSSARRQLYSAVAMNLLAKLKLRKLDEFKRVLSDGQITEELRLSFLNETYTKEELFRCISYVAAETIRFTNAEFQSIANIALTNPVITPKQKARIEKWKINRQSAVRKRRVVGRYYGGYNHDSEDDYWDYNYY
ncbi:17031_t:CDS:2 [Acaulospora morrowiae]|uniref:17031_t:CDS:1 n=1 Tax=Acaulospora morrowiae TaxID=94023 RepID=A0A9N9APY3_9GLOM|nr:17031_t:CDS:2 [Acaulospora morrowiae]